LILAVHDAALMSIPGVQPKRRVYSIKVLPVNLLDVILLLLLIFLIGSTGLGCSSPFVSEPGRGTSAAGHAPGALLAVLLVI
jgi:biopolymer transport protein ExbD